MNVALFFTLFAFSYEALTFNLDVYETSNASLSLNGNSTSLNYFYAEIQIGSQRQKQSLIIDTGSFITAIPCEPYCKQCGSHMNKRYNMSQSNKSKVIRCDNNKTSIQCKNELKGKCNENKECGFINAYGEGSSISGIFFNDTIYINNTNSVDITLGCIRKENKLFLHQLADGIIGLSPSDMSFTNLLFKSKGITYNTFSLCLSNINKGMISFGDEIKVEGNSIIPFYGTDFYRININEILIEKDIMKVDSMGIIDSGTTLTYLPKKLFNRLYMYITSFCSAIDKCLGDDYINKDRGICYIPKHHVTYKQFIESFPVIEFALEGNTTFNWYPNNYMIRNNNNKKAIEFCISINSWNQNEILLGTGWMHNHKFNFDLEKRAIVFHRSNCGIKEDSMLSESYIVEDKYFENYDNRINQKIAIMIIVFVIFSISFTLIKLNKKENIKQN